MDQINRLRAALDELHPIIPSPFKAVLFKLYLRRPDLRNKAFKFQWAGQPFWGRGVDFYGSISDVFLEDDYAPILPVLEKLPENPAILDAGGNIGSFALYCLSHRPDATVHSIEPEETTFQFLSRNAKSVPNWHPHQLALWEQDGTTEFHRDEDCSAGSRIGAAESNSYQVKTSRLQTFIDEHMGGRVDFLKMDIEGVEDVVLSDSETLLEVIPYLIIETHPDVCDEARVIEILNRHYPMLENLKSNQDDYKILIASKGGR
ncbi:MAG: FkbM family methyltransferase [Anaerolineales bacterium]